MLVFNLIGFESSRPLALSMIRLVIIRTLAFRPFACLLRLSCGVARYLAPNHGDLSKIDISTGLYGNFHASCFIVQPAINSSEPRGNLATSLVQWFGAY